MLTDLQRDQLQKHLDRSMPLIHAFVWRYSFNSDQQEELVSYVLYEIALRFEKFDAGRACWNTFVTQVCWSAITHYRRFNARPSRSPVKPNVHLDELMIKFIGGPDDNLASVDCIDAMDSVLKTLRPEVSEAFIRCALGGELQTDLAIEKGVNSKTMHERVRDGREALKSLYPELVAV